MYKDQVSVPNWITIFFYFDCSNRKLNDAIPPILNKKNPTVADQEHLHTPVEASAGGGHVQGRAAAVPLARDRVQDGRGGGGGGGGARGKQSSDQSLSAAREGGLV